MKFGQPILSSELSGSLAGVVASSSRGGTNYFRVRATPGNPRSFAQTTMRLILTSVAAAWSSILNDAERAAWAAIAPSNSSGIDAYMKSNSNTVLAGLGRLDAAPASLALSTTPEAAPVVDASDHKITFAANATGAIAGLNVYISKPQKSSRLSQQFGFTYAGTIDGVIAGGFVTIPTTHPAYQLTAGDIVYVRCVQVGKDVGGDPTGQIATEQDFRVIVTA